MDYDELDKEDFDAVVTGELTHYALWLEEEINGIICDYFSIPKSRIYDFRRLVLYRDGLTFQDKLEIVRGMLPLLGKAAEDADLKSMLKQVEDFKAWRNAMAHGLDIARNEDIAKLKIEIVTRSGKERVVEITPESHERMMDEVGSLLEKLQNARAKLNGTGEA
jgi:hypothetical protein